MPSSFYKEYTRIHYDRLHAIKKEYRIEFTHPTEPTQLPTVFIDTMMEHPYLYLLNWRENQTAKTLYVRGITEK
jgi:hypothetical protein